MLEAYAQMLLVIATAASLSAADPKTDVLAGNGILETGELTKDTRRSTVCSIRHHL